MNIGQASAQSGLSSKTIRYYEAIGLVIPARQAGNQYRDYSEADLAQLRFLNSARQLGFGLQECRSLLELYRDPSRASADVKDLALTQVRKLDEQLEQLTSMRDRLVAMANAGSGNTDSEGKLRERVSKPPLPTMSFTLLDADS